MHALDRLRQLDDSLYERFVATRGVAVEPVANAASLRRLWDETFGGLLDVLAYCRLLEEDIEQAPANDALGNFDFGDLDGGEAAEADTEFDLGSSDIGDLLEAIDEHVVEGDAERWKRILDKVSSIAYGLRSQHTDAKTRMELALGACEIGQVLGLLDDTQSSASEGVHALVTAVYEAFLPEVDPATIVPGYTTSLGRALLVRRGLAELGLMLAPLNDVLQGSDRSVYLETLETIRDVMRGFVLSVVCRAMRAADRWQVVEFEQSLADQPLAAARLTSEGLVKYLESLGSVNQREVLLLHDQRTLEEIRESLADARQLIDISPRTAQELLTKAFNAVRRLRGRSPGTDRLIIQAERSAAANPEPATLLVLLETVLQAA